MKKVLGAILLVGGLLGQIYSAVAEPAKPSAQASTDRIVWFAPIRGAITPASSSYLQAALRAAEKDHAQALIVELDTPGGLVTSVREMAQAIDQSKIPVVVYVTPAGAIATSAGALLRWRLTSPRWRPARISAPRIPVDSSAKTSRARWAKKPSTTRPRSRAAWPKCATARPRLAEMVVTKSRSMTAQEAHDAETRRTHRHRVARICSSNSKAAKYRSATGAKAIDPGRAAR